LVQLLARIALIAVPAPEAPGFRGGILRSCNRHERAGVSFFGTNLRAAIGSVNLFFAWQHSRNQAEIAVLFSVVAPAAVQGRTFENDTRQRRRILGLHPDMMAIT
jgi:hypothetical protein